MSFGRWLGLIGLGAALLLLWHLRDALVLIFAAVVLAMALCTLVGTVRRRLGCPRPLALLLSLLAVGLVTVIVATAIIPPFLEQFGELIQQLPRAASELLKLLQRWTESIVRMLYGGSDGGISWLQRTMGRWPETGSAVASGLGGGAMRLLGVAGNVGTGLLQTLFVVAVALMVAIQPGAYREAVLLLVPSFYRRRFRRVLLQCGDALSAWMVGVLISSLCVGVLAAIGLSLLGVKLVAANALLAGLLNVIPNVGPTLSTIFPMAVALLDSPWKALAVLLLYILVQNLESYLITPSVMQHQVKLLPGLPLTAQLVFTVLFGPLGLLLALPLAVCLQVLLREVLIRDILDAWRSPRRLR
ncbi:MAG: AI-2E family transporter [Synechococcaceae cyanobacterium]|nr:AI-2E family transporter [Synechococcaceae cyanobacterium]